MAPIRAYKHVSPQFAESFATGDSIKVGLNWYYQKMENDRGDKYEGRIVRTAKNHHSTKETRTASEEAALNAIGIVGCGSVTIINSSFGYTAVPHYIFCLSEEPDFTRSISLAEAIFEVKDVRLFADIITKSCPELHGEPLLGPVTYLRSDVDLGIDPRTFSQGLNVFRKNAEFSFEKEFRIAWRAVGGPEDRPDVRLIKAPEIREVIRRIA